MSSDWITMCLRAKKSCIQQNNLRKVHYEFEDGKEMVEEYNLDTNVLVRRAWRVKKGLGGEGDWDIEIGEAEPACLKAQNEFIKENSNQPFITRRITKKNMEWRIRNLPYPIETYTVKAEPEIKCMTIRTTNKKYFKRITIPELEHVALLPQQENIDFSHKFNTLIINYKKPKEVLDMEQIIWEDVKKLKPQNNSDPNNCKPS